MYTVHQGTVHYVKIDQTHQMSNWLIRLVFSTLNVNVAADRSMDLRETRTISATGHLP